MGNLQDCGTENHRAVVHGAQFILMRKLTQLATFPLKLSKNYENHTEMNEDDYKSDPSLPGVKRALISQSIMSYPPHQHVLDTGLSNCVSSH